MTEKQQDVAKLTRVQQFCYLHALKTSFAFLLCADCSTRIDQIVELLPQKEQEKWKGSKNSVKKLADRTHKLQTFAKLKKLLDDVVCERCSKRIDIVADAAEQES